MSGKRILLVLALSLSVAGASGVFANNKLNQVAVFKVRIHNDTGTGVVIRAIGERAQASYRDAYEPGQSRKIMQFIGGERVVVAWDDVTDRIVATHRINVTQNGHIRVPRNWAVETTNGTEVSVPQGSTLESVIEVDPANDP